MSRRSARERRPDPSRGRHAARAASEADDEILSAPAASLRTSQTGTSAGYAAATPPAVLRALAGRMGNRRMAELHRASSVRSLRAEAGERDQAGDVQERAPVVARAEPDASAIRRDVVPAPITVNLSYSQGAISHYAVSGATVRAAAKACRKPPGAFRFHPVWHVSNPSGTIKTVTITVSHHIQMPRWTQASSQPQSVQDAWNRLYDALLAHEEEHQKKCHTHFDDLRTELQERDGSVYTMDKIKAIVRTSVAEHASMHRNHTGFTTSATIQVSDDTP